MRRTDFHKRSSLSSIITLAFFLLSACGSSGGGSTAGGGIGGTGVIASGAVTNKGSVYVNGSIYDTNPTTTFTLEDSLGSEDKIRRGMVVLVDGTRDTVTTGTATSVTYEDVVEGPLTSYSTPPSEIITLTVLGQTVIVEEGVTYVDDGTVLAPNPLPQNLPDFSAVTALEVSGLRDASSVNGVIRATYIEIKTGLTEYEVKGVVENDPTSTYDFKIAGLGIDFSGTAPPVGTTVEVKGTAFTPSNALVATSVETRTAGLGETEFDHADIEGFLTDLNTISETFTLDGQVINYSGATFEAGVVGDLNDGIKVEAEGAIFGGILEADKIKFKESIRIEGDASDSDADGSFTVKGLNGLTIFVDAALTEYDGFSNVSEDDHIEIRGREIAGSGFLMATEIRLRSADSRIEFQAPATAFAPPPGDNVTLMDSITIDTTDPFIFKDQNDAAINRTVFYTNLTTGDLVKARGNLLAGPTADWQEIELED